MRDMSQEHSSELFYHGTNKEVRVGDRVRMKRFLRKASYGTVCYIPGISAKHPDLEYENKRFWAIRADDGTIYPMVYAPKHRLGQPGPKIELIARTDYPGLSPDIPLE